MVAFAAATLGLGNRMPGLSPSFCCVISRWTSCQLSTPRTARSSEVAGKRSIGAALELTLRSTVRPSQSGVDHTCLGARKGGTGGAELKGRPRHRAWLFRREPCICG